MRVGLAALFAGGVVAVSFGSQAPATMTNTIGMEFVLIRPGTMQVGVFRPPYPKPVDPNAPPAARAPSPALTPDEYARLERMAKADSSDGFPVTISRAFYIGKYEVTQAQWTRVMGTNPSIFQEGKVADDASRHPVENVTWDDAQKFVERLNAAEQTTAYRLPTEFEWEYAARAGEDADTPWPVIRERAVAGYNQYFTTHMVGGKKPNAWGVYDMQGNVWEWVQDFYNEKLFADPTPPVGGKEHVLKGGGFLADVKNAIPATHAAGPGSKFDVGFRIVRDVSTPAPQSQAEHPGADFLKRPPVTRLAPEMQQQLFLLPDGYTAELVLADPQIEDPVGVTFDGNGRMYVLEMRSYMRDVEGSNSREPISRISRWEDSNGDGTYDRHTVFADKLVLPRIAFPLEDGVLLVLETDNRDLFKFTDTNGDGVADKKEVFYTGYGRVTNMEWQPGGMVWALDNWVYTTYNPFRLRIAPDGRVLREETDVNGGQWGVAQDNYGKLWFVDGGTERGPVNFQTPIYYGAFNAADQLEPGFEVPWPAPGGIADMQGGMARVRLPEGTLNHFTSAAGPEIFRGHRLPEDMVGDLLFTEPVGRMVRRAKVVVTDSLTQLRNAHPQSEFIRSTDPLFRPVNVSNAPDGTIYISDMYTGIIQDAQFIAPGSYLRRKIEQYELDKQHNWGRIWRIRHSSVEPDRTPPRMYNETAAQLMSHLNHPSGWWRDTAQKLLVLRQDKSIVPKLKATARASPTQLGRIHALWTLEGLGGLDAALLRSLMKDADAQIRIQAIRASESLYKATPGDKSLAADYRALTKDSDPNVVLQALLTINLHRLPQSEEVIRKTMEASPSRGVQEIGAQLLRPPSALGQPASNDPGMGYLNLTPEERATLMRGERTYKELCFSCHGPDGKGTPLAGAPAGTLMAPPVAGSSPVLGHRDYVIKVLLHGLTGPMDGKEYTGGVMAPMGGNTDEWIADIANYIRNAFGNSARPYVTPAQVADVRRSTPRRTPWTYPELLATVPQPLTNASSWTLTASHNTELAANASGVKPGGRWDSGGAQQPGMWLQIELPEPATLVEIQLDASVTGRANPGLGGFGGLGETTPTRARTPLTGGQTGTGPGAYRVELSMDGKQWSATVARGRGETPTTVVPFRATPAKFIRVTLTESAERPWIVQRVRIYHTPR